MDLVQTVRKEGSRGGRADFKWEDVANSNHRENYLGHSLMAPVGRWQKDKDLHWWTRSDAEGNGMSEAEARKAEIKRIKEAEDDAIARALGYDAPSRSLASENPNTTKLGDHKLVHKTVKEGLEEDAGEDSTVRGLGYGGFTGLPGAAGEDVDVMEGTHPEKGQEEQDLRHKSKPDGQRRREHRRSDDRKRRHHRSHRRDHGRAKHSRGDTDNEKERHHRRRHHSRSRSPPGQHERRRSIGRTPERDSNRYGRRGHGDEQLYEDKSSGRHRYQNTQHKYRTHSRSR